MKWYQLLWSGIKATVSLTVGLSTIVLAVATILLWSSTNALVSEAESSSMGLSGIPCKAGGLNISLPWPW